MGAQYGALWSMNIFAVIWFPPIPQFCRICYQKYSPVFESNVAFGGWILSTVFPCSCWYSYIQLNMHLSTGRVNCLFLHWVSTISVYSMKHLLKLSWTKPYLSAFPRKVRRGLCVQGLKVGSMLAVGNGRAMFVTNGVHGKLYWAFSVTDESTDGRIKVRSKDSAESKARLREELEGWDVALNILEVCFNTSLLCNAWASITLTNFCLPLTLCSSDHLLAIRFKLSMHQRNW